MIALVLAALATPQPPAEAPELAQGPDRSAPPPVLPPVPLPPDELTRATLSNGIEVWHAQVPRVRKAHIELRWWKGRLELRPDPATAAAAEAASDLWGVSTATYDSAAISELTDTREIEVWASIGDHSSTVTLTAPVDELDAGMALFTEVVFQPVYTKRELKLLVEERLRGWTVLGPASPGSVATGALVYGWNPATHPYGWRPDPAAWPKLKTRDLDAVHADLLATGPLSVLVVGDLPLDAVLPRLEAALGGMTHPGGQRAPGLPAPTPTATRVLAVDMPHSEQAVIRMRSAAPALTDPERVPLQGAAFALGGHFLARLNRNLREDKGWTYGVRSDYAGAETRGHHGVAVDVPADKLAAAVTELQREIDGVAAEGITEAERDAWWRARVAQFNGIRATSLDAYGYYHSLQSRQLTVADELAYLDAVRTVDNDQVRAIATTWIGPEAPRVWAVAGPRAQLEAGFAELGWTPEWVTPTAAILGELVGGPLPEL